LPRAGALALFGGGAARAELPCDQPAYARADGGGRGGHHAFAEAGRRGGEPTRGLGDSALHGSAALTNARGRLAQELAAWTCPAGGGRGVAGTVQRRGVAPGRRPCAVPCALARFPWRFRCAERLDHARGSSGGAARRGWITPADRVEEL